MDAIIFVDGQQLDSGGVDDTLKINDDLVIVKSAKEGGFFEAEWSISGSRSALKALYDSWLMKRVRVRSNGAVVWNGWVWSLDMVADGRPSTKTMDGFFNKVKVIYNTPYGDTAETNWIHDTASQRTYGIFERVLNPSGYEFVAEGAADYALLQLSEHAQPQVSRGRLQPNTPDKLVIRAAGDAYRANTRYTTIPPIDEELNQEMLVTDFARNVIADNPHLAIGQITPSASTMLVATEDLKQRYVPTWELLQELRDKAATDGHPYTVCAWVGTRVNFIQASPEPLYIWRWQHYAGDGKQEPGADSIPGIQRDKTSIAATSPTWRDDRRDYWIDTIEVDFGNDKVELLSEPFGTDILYGNIAGGVI